MVGGDAADIGRRTRIATAPCEGAGGDNEQCCCFHFLTRLRSQRRRQPNQVLHTYGFSSTSTRSGCSDRSCGYGGTRSRSSPDRPGGQTACAIDSARNRGRRGLLGLWKLRE